MIFGPEFCLDVWDALERVVVMKCIGLYVVRKCHSVRVLCIEVFVFGLLLSPSDRAKSEKCVRCN